MECEEEDFAIPTAVSSQRLSSSPEFSTIMNVMKFARQSLRSKRNQTLQVPQIKITLASETKNDEGEARTVETTQNIITEGSSANESVFSDYGEDCIASASSNEFDCETLTFKEKPKHYSTSSVQIVVDESPVIGEKQEKVESYRHPSLRETSKGRDNKTEYTKHKSRFEFSKTLPMSRKNRPKSVDLSYRSYVSNSQNSHSRKNVAPTGRSKSLEEESASRGTEVRNFDMIESVGGKETERVKTNKMKLTRTQHIGDVKELHWVGKIKHKGRGTQFNSHQQHTLIGNSVANSAHKNKANEYRNEFHKTKFISCSHGNSCEDEEGLKGNTNLMTSRDTGNNRLPLQGRRSRSFTDISDVFPLRTTDGHLTNYLPDSHPHQGSSRGGVSINTKNASTISSRKMFKVKPVKGALSRKLSRSDSELNRRLSTATPASTTKMSWNKPQKIDLTMSMDTQNNFGRFNGAHDNVLEVYSQLATISSDSTDTYARGRSSSCSAPQTERLPHLANPGTTRRASTIPAPVSISRTSPVERAFSSSSPSPSRSRSNSWSNLLALSKVFNQINNVYSQVSSSFEELDKVPDVHVDEVLKSWNVKQDDMKVIRSVVQSPRRDSGFSSADYEQLKECRYLRNEANSN